MPFPAFSVFQRVTADQLNSMTPLVITKVSSNVITSNATFANDSEFAAITLGIGTWSIDALYYAAGIPAGGVKVQWTFSGTLGNTPFRTNVGIATTNAAAANVSTPTNMGISQWNTSVSYGTGNTVSNYGVIMEMCEEFQVTVAGTFAIQFAQATANASSTTIRAGSRLRIRQLT